MPSLDPCPDCERDPVHATAHAIRKQHRKTDKILAGVGGLIGIGMGAALSSRIVSPRGLRLSRSRTATASWPTTPDSVNTELALTTMDRVDAPPAEIPAEKATPPDRAQRVGRLLRIKKRYGGT